MERLASNTREASQRTLTHLKNTIQDTSLRELISYYTVEGSVGHLLDAERDSLRVHSFQVFEMEHIMNMGARALVPVLLYLFHRLEQRFDGSPTLLILDEAWVLIQHPLFREKIQEWLRVLRKSNVAVVFASQSLNDVIKSPIADVIFESTSTKIFLPNPEASSPEFSALYQNIGLNERQIQIIANATPKRHYYLVNTDGKRLFDLGLGRIALAFVGSSPKKDRPFVDDLVAKYGKEWVPFWLANKGVSSDWIRFWRERALMEEK